MSQVKKLQSGGQSIGSLTIGGKRYQATPEMIQALSTYLSGYGEAAAPLAGLTSALQSGTNVDYDPVGNVITGMKGKWAGVDNESDDKRDTGKSKWRRKWEATFDTDAHRFRNAVALLSGFSFDDKPKEVPLNLQDIYGNRVFYKYKENEDGTKTLLKDDPQSLEIASRLKAMSDYLSHPEEESKKKYKLADWYSPQRLSGLRALYNQNQSRWQTVLDEIGKRAETGNLTPEDLAFLENFNIGDNKNGIGNSPQDDTSGKLSNADRKKWKDAGYSDDIIKLLEGRASLGNDGVLRMIDGDDWGLGNYASGNIYFNDDFYRYTEPGVSGKLNALKNYTLYKGGLYNRDKITPILNLPGGYNALMQSGDWTKANELIRTWFNPDAPLVNPGKIGEGQYSTFLSRPGYRFGHITGQRKLSDDAKSRLGLDDSDYQLIQYVNLNNPDEHPEDPYRTYKYRYTLLNNNADQIPNVGDISYDDLIAIPDAPDPRELQAHRMVNSGNNSAYRNMYRDDYYNLDNKYSGISIYRDKDNPNENVIIHLPEIYAEDTGGMNIKLPKEVARELMPLLSNKKVLEGILGDATKKDTFIELLSHMVQKWWARNTGSISESNNDTRDITDPFGKNASSERNTDYISNLFGIDKNSARRLWDIIKAYANTGNADSRRANTLVAQLNEDDLPIYGEANGGILKHQHGGVARANTNAIGVTQQNVNTGYTNPKNAAYIGSSKDWTRADDLDVAALIGDLASLGLAIAPGANIGSAIAGFGSSTAKLSADLARGTKGAGWNYLLNLGMDAATLIPILGGGAKGFKVVRAIKKALPTIIKAASAYGLGSAVVTSAKKIANGEKWTVRDVSNVVNGLTAGVAIGKQGGFGRSTTKGKVTTKTMEISGKRGNTVDLSGKKITIEGDEVAAIARKDKSKQADALDELLWSKVKKVTGNNEISKSDALSAVDRTQFDKEVRNWNPFKSGIKGFGKKDVEFNLGAVTKSGDRVPIEATGKGFRDWWHGVDKYNLEYNSQLKGIAPVKVTKKTTTPAKAYELSRTDTNVWANNTRKYRTKGKVESKEIPMSEYQGRSFTSEYTPGGIRKYGRGIGMEVLPGTARYVARVMTPAELKTNRERVYKSIALPQWIKQNEFYTDEPPTGVVMRPVYKKGGKITKAVNGLTTAPFKLSNEEAGKNWRDFLVKSSLNGNFDSQLLLNRMMYDDSLKVSNALKQNDVTPTVTINTSNDLVKDAQVATKRGREGDQSEYPETPYNIDLNVPLNWIRAKHSMNESDKQLQNWLGRPEYHMQAPLLNAPRFIDSGAGDAYQIAANKTRLSKNVNSNAVVNESLLRQRQADAQNLEAQARLARSQEFGKYKAGLDEFNNNIVLQNTDIANKNRQLDWQHDIEDVQMRNANIAEKSKFWDQAAYASQDWYNRQHQIKQNINAFRQYNRELPQIQAWYNNQKEALNRKYNGDFSSSAASSELNALNNILEMKMQGLQLHQLESSLAFPFIAKKGGKIGKNSKVTYSRDPYPELLLQNAKSSSKFVEKLSDSVIKLILQTSPLYVS